MKIRFLSVGAAVAAGLVSASALFAGCDGTVEITAENARVVVAPDAGKVVLFAADEMTNFLSRVLGAPVPIVNEVKVEGEGEQRTVNIFLGENDWSRAKGLEPAKQLADDGFYILAEGTDVYIVGHDDPAADIRKAIQAAVCPQSGSQFYRATLFGVYDFLERFAGCRFYFPGSDDLGIVTPRRAAVRVPAGKIVEEPYFDITRRWTSPGAPRVGVGGPLRAPRKGERSFDHQGRNNLLNMYRLRIKSVDIPGNHGSCHLELQERFGKAHPEYFALMKDAKGNLFRDSEPVKRGYPQCQLCWSSGILDEFFKDAVACSRGDDPKTRGFKNGYPHEGIYGQWICFTPQDGFRGCLCEKCQAAFDRTKGAYASELVHGAVANVARRLLDAGTGMKVRGSAYSCYRDLPKCDIPSNVVMGIARTGPWAETSPARRDREDGEVIAWAKKTGQRVSLHNWACKYTSSNIPGLPSMTPRAVGSYYSRMAPYVRGAYMESSSERMSHVYLNIYLYSKLAWNPKFDWKAALDEHYRLLFGAGAEPMRKIYERFEDLWLTKIVSNVKETNMGTIAEVPTVNVIWNEIYTAELIAELRALAKEALAAAGADTLEGRRVKVFADDLVGALEYERNAYFEKGDVAREEAYRRASKNPNLLEGIVEKEYHFQRRPGAKGGRFEASVPFALKGGTKYRLSAIVKYKDVVSVDKPHKLDGVWTYFWDDANERFYSASVPVGGLRGSSDWVALANEFTTPKNVDARHLQIRLRNAYGEAWIRGVRLEEAEPAPSAGASRDTLKPVASPKPAG